MGERVTERMTFVKHRILPYVAFAGAAATLLFWTIYYSGLFFSEQEMIRTFEAAFPVSDGLLFVALMISGFGLLRRRPSGTFFLIVAASMALYLGFVDILFYLSQDAYLPFGISSALEMFINLFCVIGGTVGLVCGWYFWTHPEPSPCSS